MEKKKAVKILMVDKQAMKLADPLVELLNIDSEEPVYFIRYCENYTEALSMLDEADITMVELDLTKEYFMPGDKDFLPWIKEDNAGYRLLTHIKKEYPSMKVILLVDYPACEDPQSEVAKILDKGADCYIIKPFAISKLVKEIQRISTTL